jgi:hypothetical protein
MRRSSTAAAAGDDEKVERSRFFEQFEGRRALARDDVGVIVGRDDGQAAFAGNAAAERFAVVALAVVDDPPRNLNAPARWKFSHLKYNCAPARSFSVREVTTGVRCATPAICRAALWISVKVGVIGDMLLPESL